jgi:hypothetical protein
MLIFCEECGEKYILPQHLSSIPAEFQCVVCLDIFKFPQSALNGSQTEQTEQMDKQMADDIEQ